MILQIVGGTLIVTGLALLVWRRMAEREGSANGGVVHVRGPVGLFVFLVGAALFAMPYVLPNLQGGSTPEVLATAAHRSTSSPASVPSMPEGTRITSPADYTSVSGKDGTVVQGTSTDSDKDLWVFVIADDENDTSVFYLSVSDPLPVVDGHWSLLVQPIGGGSSDIGVTFPIVVVEANGSCSKQISSKPANRVGDITFSSLPTGCKEADRVRVVMAKA
ncbi:hypothetical protein [Hamadaea tsunoensis]|uniref:hypothetical protein n=1 Tax=Hamadaea tsunoensis TaxID=53368 RepID=UPI0012FB7DF2|nr:hypothetical protein [Hamadaea tsunoensis]